MRYITCTYRNKEDFLKDYSEDGSNLEIFYMSRDSFTVGDRIVLRIILRDLAQEYYIRGIVKESFLASKESLGLPPGIRITFLKSEKQKVNNLKALAERRAVPRFSRSTVRIPVRLKAVIRRSRIDKAIETQAIDLSESGAFFVLEEDYPESTVLDIRLYHDSLIFPLHIKGTIVRKGQINWENGVGVRFDLTSRRKRKLIRILDALQSFTED